MQICEPGDGRDAVCDSSYHRLVFFSNQIFIAETDLSRIGCAFYGIAREYCTKFLAFIPRVIASRMVKRFFSHSEANLRSKYGTAARGKTSLVSALNIITIRLKKPMVCRICIWYDIKDARLYSHTFGSFCRRPHDCNMQVLAYRNIPGTLFMLIITTRTPRVRVFLCGFRGLLPGKRKFLSNTRSRQHSGTYRSGERPADRLGEKRLMI